MTGEGGTLGTATYNADDDTLRWSPGARLDANEYNGVTKVQLLVEHAEPA